MPGTQGRKMCAEGGRFKLPVRHGGRSVSDEEQGGGACPGALGCFQAVSRGARVSHGDQSKAETEREVGSRQESDLHRLEVKRIQPEHPRSCKKDPQNTEGNTKALRKDKGGA